MKSKKNRGNLLAYALIGIAALSVGFVTIIKSNDSSAPDRLVGAAAAAATTPSSTPSPTPSVPPTNPPQPACTKQIEGQTYSKTTTKADGSTLTKVQQCMVCGETKLANGTWVDSTDWVDISISENKMGTLCGSKTTISTSDTSNTWTTLPNKSCQDVSSTIVTTANSDHAASDIVCTTGSCPATTSTTTLACTVTTNTTTEFWQTGYAWGGNPPGWKIPPGGSNFYDAKIMNKQAIKDDTSCPSPSRSVTNTCSVSGDTGHFGLACPKAAAAKAVARAAAAPTPTPTPSSCTSPTPTPTPSRSPSSNHAAVIQAIPWSFFNIF